MLGFRDQSILPIGIDVGVRAVRMVQLRRRGDQLELIAAASTEVAQFDEQHRDIYDNAVLQAIKSMRQSHKFRGVECVSAIASDRIACKSLRMPQMPETDMDQAIRWEAKDRLGFDMTDGQLAYFRSGEVRRGSETKDEYLVFAATPEVLVGHLKQLSTAGLKVLAVDLQPCALFRALQRVIPSQQAAHVTAIVDMGVASTQFLVIQDDRPVFYKNIEIGDQELNDAIAQKLGVSVVEAAQLRQRFAFRDLSDADESSEAPLEQACFDGMRSLLEDLAKELDLCLRYYGVTFRGARPEVIYGTGGQSYCHRSLDLLAGALGSRIEIIQPLRGVGNLGQNVRPDRSSDWAVATGLSLYPARRAKQEAAA